MSKETIYPLTEREANGILNAVQRGTQRMIAAQDLMDLPLLYDTFESTLEGLLGRSWRLHQEEPLEEEKEAAYRWLVQNYEILYATFTAVRELVNDTRDSLEMLTIEGIEEHFSRRERVS